MASTLEDAALGRAVRALAENADRARTYGLLMVVTKVPGGEAGFPWHGFVRTDDPRPLPSVDAATLTELFTELAALIPDDKEKADG